MHLRARNGSPSLASLGNPGESLRARPGHVKLGSSFYVSPLKSTSSFDVIPSYWTHHSSLVIIKGFMMTSLHLSVLLTTQGFREVPTTGSCLYHGIRWKPSPSLGGRGFSGKMKLILFYGDPGCCNIPANSVLWCMCRIMKHLLRCNVGCNQLTYLWPNKCGFMTLGHVSPWYMRVTFMVSPCSSVLESLYLSKLDT